MRRIRTYFALLCVVALTGTIGLVTITPASAAPGDTALDPIMVSSCADILSIDSALDKYYELTMSLDCTGNGNAIRIGDSSNSFTGAFEGNEYTITIDLDNDINYMALFPKVYEGEISNLTVSGNVVGEGYAAGLIGSAEDSTFDNIHSTATVEGQDRVGGVIGYGTAINVTNSSSSSNVTGSSDLVGGFIGSAFCNTTISDSTASGNVDGDDYTGGFAGRSECDGIGATFTSISATGDVTGASATGGLVGYLGISAIVQSFASGSVTGAYGTGGLVGTSFGVGTDEGTSSYIAESYSTGAVTTTEEIAGGFVGNSDFTYMSENYSRSSVTGDNVAGFVGNQDNTYIEESYSTGSVPATEGNGGLTRLTEGEASGTDDSYWDTQTSGFPNSSSGEGKTTAEMKDEATFLDVGWNLVETWGLTPSVNNGYPCLMWTSESCTFVLEVDDEDGIPAEVEDAAPNSGDANDDDIADSEQENVASFVNEITGQYVTVVVPDGCDLTEVGSAAEASKEVQDSSFTYPVGLVNFTANCGDPGITITVEQFYFNAGVASGFVARKYTAYNQTYQDLIGASVADVTVGNASAVKLVFSLTDGGQLDNDQDANGIIVDPAGLAVAPTGTLPATGNSGQANALFALVLIGIGSAASLISRKRYIHL